MHPALRSALLFSSLTASAIFSAGCEDGNGSGTQRVYFSMTNYDGCVVAHAGVDLEAANADLARNDDGTVACEISPALAAAGCESDFAEIGNGAQLAVEISGCGINVVQNLFSCDFRHVDISKLAFEPSEDCGCLTHSSSCYENGICDLCASDDPNRSGCENCDNNLDDDDDDKIDCSDPDCRFAESCGFGRTTLSCRVSTTTTTDTTTSTTAGSSLDIEGPSILTAP